MRFATRGAGDLAVWAVVFSERPGLRFGGGRDAGVFLRLKRGEDEAEEAARVLLLYEEKRKEVYPAGEEKEKTDGKME